MKEGENEKESNGPPLTFCDTGSNLVHLSLLHPPIKRVFWFF